jgi:hypothetical protein
MYDFSVVTTPHVDETDRPAIHPNVAWIDVEGEIVAVQREAETIHLIGSSGALLWPFLDGSATVGELAEDIGEVFGIGQAQALADVTAFVAEMRSQMLVTVRAAEPVTSV